MRAEVNRPPVLVVGTGVWLASEVLCFAGLFVYPAGQVFCPLF